MTSIRPGDTASAAPENEANEPPLQFAKPHAAAALALLALTTLAMAQEPVPENQITWLFILQGVVEQVDGNEMTIAGSPEALAFTDAPSRRVRPLDIAGLTLLWEDGGPFHEILPNASLIDETEEVLSVIEIYAFTGNSQEVVLTFGVLEGVVPAVGDHIAITIDGADLCQPVDNVMVCSPFDPGGNHL